MKRIHNTETGKTIWRGEQYLVDGVAATVEPPLYLLDEVERPNPEFNAATHRLEAVTAHADIESGEWVEISSAVVALTTEEIASASRLAARTDLRTTWEALPAWIRGPFGDKFDAAYRMVIAGDYEAAEALIEYAEMPSGYTLEQAATFAQVQSQMAAGIAALAQI
jgi:hypothetical protein